jgi:hypothetical protein
VNDYSCIIHVVLLTIAVLGAVGIRSRTLGIGEIVIAPYEDSFYRGQVLLVDNGKVTVEFVDFGDKATMDISQIREPTEEEMECPIYGVKLMMEGVPVNAFCDQSVNVRIASALDATFKLEIVS